MTPPIPWTAYACLAASMALVGSYVGLSKLLLGAFPVFLLAWLRFAIAALAMAHWLRRGADEPPLSAADARGLFWLGLLGNAAFSLCMLYGVALASAVAAGVVMAALPAAVALLARSVLGERIAPRVGAGIVCAVAGIALAAWRGPATGDDAPAHALGIALLTGAVLCEASYVVIGKRLATTVPPRRISALVNLWGLVLVTPLGLWQLRGFDFAAVPVSAWVLLVYYALAASMWAVWLWMRGLREVPAPQAGVFTVLLPIAAAAVGVLVLGEAVDAAQAAAFALALVGLLLAAWPARTQGGSG